MNLNADNQQSTITCPHCNSVETFALEHGVNLHFYRCQSCGAILKPKSGDCCVLCSFGDRDCLSAEQNLAA